MIAGRHHRYNRSEDHSNMTTISIMLPFGYTVDASIGFCPTQVLSVKAIII